MGNLPLSLSQLLLRYQSVYHPVVAFNPDAQRLYPFNFTAENTELSESVIADTAVFSKYVTGVLQREGCVYGIGGYGELRTLYSRSDLFGETRAAQYPGTAPGEPRRLHLGVDIWGAAGTAVHAFLEGWVHSFAFNNHFGDYGATLITRHELEGRTFYTLYGHLRLLDIKGIDPGRAFHKGSVLAHFGESEENGHWPPHLHMQVIENLEGKQGDYPGVCRNSEREFYLNNCPDPDLILQLNRFLRDPKTSAAED